LPRVTSAADLEARIDDLWDFWDPASSAERFRDAADAETDPEVAAVLRTQQARATGLAGDFGAEARLLDEVEAAGLDDAATHARARLAIERGRLLNSTGDPAAAAPLFDEAHLLATQCGVPGLAMDALHMQAIAASATSGPDAAVAINERALAEIKGSGDPGVQRWLGTILINLGLELRSCGRGQDALEVFERAVPIREERDHRLGVIARWHVGRTLRDLGRYDEALALMRELAADPVGAEDEYVHEEITANLEALAEADPGRR
jgi:tetratricopeptide (TPR) repeat protein